MIHIYLWIYYRLFDSLILLKYFMLWFIFIIWNILLVDLFLFCEYIIGLTQFMIWNILIFPDFVLYLWYIYRHDSFNIIDILILYDSFIHIDIIIYYDSFTILVFLEKRHTPPVLLLVCWLCCLQYMRSSRFLIAYHSCFIFLLYFLGFFWAFAFVISASSAGFTLRARAPRSFAAGGYRLRRPRSRIHVPHKSGFLSWYLFF
jgi:hypothetical protein